MLPYISCIDAKAETAVYTEFEIIRLMQVTSSDEKTNRTKSEVEAEQHCISHIVSDRIGRKQLSVDFLSKRRQL